MALLVSRPAYPVRGRTVHVKAAVWPRMHAFWLMTCVSFTVPQVSPLPRWQAAATPRYYIGLKAHQGHTSLAVSACTLWKRAEASKLPPRPFPYGESVTWTVLRLLCPWRHVL